MTSRIRLVAASDDFLLEERLGVHVAELSAELGGASPEVQSDDASPGSVATELVSPSLFAAERVLVAPDVRVWVDGTAPAGVAAGKTAAVDTEPLVRVIEDGVPEGMALAMGAWCGRKPSGPLVEAVEKAGVFEWIPLPPPPKPWETSSLSKEQIAVLSAVLERAAEGASFTRGAVRMLLERLGFAPRLLVQEVRKLSGAAAGAEVDEELVRRLTFPRERSLEVVRDAILGRELEPLLDLVAAAASGAPVNDWQGRRLDTAGFASVLVGQVASLLQQMLYLQRLAAVVGCGDEMAPAKTSRPRWYASHFKSGLAPELITAIKDDAPSPLLRPGGRAPSPYSLGAIFAGAGRYSGDELSDAVVAAAGVEAAMRGDGSRIETLTAWLAELVGGKSR